MMKTLFLNPPSYEGFDGGAGSRYQARREVRSFWYPTWLAQAAALVPDSTLIDAPADELTLDHVLRPQRRLRAGDHPHLDAVGGPGRQDRRGPQGGAAGRPRRIRRRPHDGAAGGDAARRPGGRFRHHRRVRLRRARHRRRRRLRRGARHRLSHRRRRHRAHRAAAADHGSRRLSVRDGRLQAPPDHRALLHRLPPAPVRVALHRARLPQPLHLLPVAADDRRARVPHAHRPSTSSPRWRTPRSCSRR